MRTAWDPGMNLTAKAEQAARKNLSSSKKALQEASEQFESLFLNILLSEMRKTVPDNELFGGGRAEKIFQSMLDQEIADNAARSQSLGLAKMIYEQMERYVPDED
ncbi:MAG: flagellar biosynthesis protein FlgJ [Firmicutes bacterium]|nr:flagellar biosynthesis protein FlgJ [Bacillota bacterium]